MRLRLLIAVFAVFAAACGGTGDSAASPGQTEAPTTTAASTTAAPATTDGSGQGTAPATTEAPSSQVPATEGPAAPAINTILSDGTAFTLADETKPVYLVFWAEW